MSHGKIIKLVRSYGAAWGRIRPNGSDRQVFFNRASLPSEIDFETLCDGQVVEFEEEPDRANGSRAVHVLVGELPRMEEERTGVSDGMICPAR